MVVDKNLMFCIQAHILKEIDFFFYMKINDADFGEYNYIYIIFLFNQNRFQTNVFV